MNLRGLQFCISVEFAGSLCCWYFLILPQTITWVFTERKRIRERKGLCCMDVVLLSDVTEKFTSTENHQIFTLSCPKILETYLNPQVSISICSNIESLTRKFHLCGKENKFLAGCAFFPYLEFLSMFPRVHVPFYLPNSFPYTSSLVSTWHGIPFCKEECNKSIYL